jgi:hypothetical protein
MVLLPGSLPDGLCTGQPTGSVPWEQRAAQHFGQMGVGALGALGDLGPARKAVSQYQCVRGRRLDGGVELPLRAGLGRPQ